MYDQWEGVYGCRTSREGYTEGPMKIGRGVASRTGGEGCMGVEPLGRGPRPVGLHDHW